MMSVILIIIGLAVCSYQTPVYTFMGGSIIVFGIFYAIFGREARIITERASKTPEFETDGYTGRVHGGTYLGVYDRDGNYIPEADLKPTIDGDYLTPAGDVVVQDSDGEYRMY